MFKINVSGQLSTMRSPYSLHPDITESTSPFQQNHDTMKKENLDTQKIEVIIQKFEQCDCTIR